MTEKTQAKSKDKKNLYRIGIIAGAIFLCVVLILGISFFWFEKTYANSFYPGVKIAGISIGGKKPSDVLKTFDATDKKLQREGIVFSYQDKNVAVTPVSIAATDPDLSRGLYSLDWDNTINDAYSLGRSDSAFKNFFQKIALLVKGKDLPVEYEIEKAILKETLKTSFGDFENPAENAALSVNGQNITVTKETSGNAFDYNEAISQLENRLQNLNFQPITLTLKPSLPTVSYSDAQNALNQFAHVKNLGALKLTDGQKTWEIPQEQLFEWLEFQRYEGEVVIGFKEDKTIDYLASLALEINVPARDAKFEMKDSRVTKFQSSQDGKKLNIEKSYQILNTHLISQKTGDVMLSVEVDPAEISMEDLNDLGIKELLGRGVSNFAGSPANRRHNIKVGSDSLNGILIKPGEDFSLLDALGEIDGENGYLRELVIKGNRTVPEYGGGLCQVGSTTFRAALRSGLPITQRKNHSYRVTYYEPAGMDATIYDPAPDMRFLNDTGHHILFTAYMDGDDLIYEFYGTHDGRKVEISPDPPSIYNVTPPGPPRYIETEELAPGEKRKVESAHSGADTYFKYTVTYPDGEVKEQEFYSRYVPWPEVWMIGKQPETASTTPESSEESLVPENSDAN